MTLSAQELYHRAVAHANAGRNAAARHDLDAAERRSGADPDLGARIRGTRAAIQIRLGDPDEADRLCREALALDGTTPATRAIIEGQLGLLALERGALGESIAWLDRAIDGVGDDPEHRSIMYLNRSVAHMEIRRLDAARRDVENAIADFAATGDDLARAMAQHNAGYVALLEGDVVRALEQMALARAVLAEASPVNAAISDLDRAVVLRDAGLVTDAERILARAAATLGSHGMRQARGEAELNLARSLLHHDAARASRVAATAARRFRALGSATWEARADALRMRAALSAQESGGGSGTRAPKAADVEAAASFLDREGLKGDAAALRLTYEGRRRDPGRSIRIAESAPMELRLLAFEARVARAQSRGRHADARRIAAAGLDQLGGWQAAFGSLDLQTSVSMHGRTLLQAGLDSALRSRSPELAFEWSERARHLAQQVVPLRPPHDPVLAAELAELRALREDLLDGLSDPRAAAIRERARERQWTTTRSAGFQERASLSRVQASIDSDTALIAYVYTGDALGALVVTSESAAVHPVAGWQRARSALDGLRADLDMAATVRSGPLADVVRRSLQERLVVLSAALLDGPAEVAGTRRLVLTVPGALAGIPWAMLPGMRDRVFTLATSATRWASLHGETERFASAGFAAGPRVARADQEVQAAASPWNGPTSLRGADATVTAVTSLASEVDVLHVAAHGRHAVDNPLFSGLELADGTLFGYDVDLVPRVPATVVLSACEVGRSSVRWGEEAVGLTRVWLHAGTRCVIASPVIVADDDACELLGAIHAGLAVGEPPAEALAAASARTGIVAPFQAHGAGF